MRVDEVEEIVATVCSRVLNAEALGVDQSLLAHGATSLSIILIITELQDELHVEISPDMVAEVIFKEPTVRGLARYVYERLSHLGSAGTELAGDAAA